MKGLNRVTSIIYFVVAVFFLIVSVIKFATEKTVSGGMLYLGIGIVMICLGFAYLSRTKKKEE